MKLRNGFVSNSSTSSFLIYGVEVEAGWEASEALYGEILDKYDLSSWCINGENLFIGESWCNVRDDETGRQFKDRVQKAINDLFTELKNSDKKVESEDEDEDFDLKDIVPEDKKDWECDTHEEAWYN